MLLSSCPLPCFCCAASVLFLAYAQTVKATLAKKELQETFLEFDLLGVLKRWLQVMQRRAGLVAIAQYGCSFALT